MGDEGSWTVAPSAGSADPPSVDTACPTAIALEEPLEMGALTGAETDTVCQRETSVFFIGETVAVDCTVWESPLRSRAGRPDAELLASEDTEVAALWRAVPAAIVALFCGS